VAEILEREMTHAGRPETVTIPARDGYPLAGSLYRRDPPSGRVAVIHAALAVPGRFYRHFAAGLADAGYTALTWDYRGIGASKTGRLRGFQATVRDWIFSDMAGVVDWVAAELEPERIFFVGHSLGGQVAGLLDNSSAIDGMATMSAQSGHWRLQGGEQKLVSLFHLYLTLPLLSRAFGYAPWSMVGPGEDLPKDAALEWAAWCRNRLYILGDETLPLERYRRFTAPVLAYSFGDDKWGRPHSVDAMMKAYPNVERRHVEPGDVGLQRIGHVGYFKPVSLRLWEDTIAWFDGI
jgi:predicted alpha/beta hydrolase